MLRRYERKLCRPNTSRRILLQVLDVRSLEIDECHVSLAEGWSNFIFSNMSIMMIRDSWRAIGRVPSIEAPNRDLHWEYPTSNILNSATHSKPHSDC